MKHEESGLRYEAGPEKPKSFDAEIAAIVGNCPAGFPWIKWTWAMDRTKFYGGKEQHVYFDPKGEYCAPPYFVMEAWVPETVYDREDWNNRRYGMLTGEMSFGLCRHAQPEPCYQHALGVGYHQKYDATIDVLGPFPDKGTWDFIRFSRSDDGRMMTFGEMLDVTRAWKALNEAPGSKQRAIDDYMRSTEEREILRTKLAEEVRGKHREYLAKELAKPELGQLMSLPSQKPALKNISNAPVPSGMAATKSGLVVPKSTLEK
jgi:hypothetical protein